VVADFFVFLHLELDFNYTFQMDRAKVLFVSQEIAQYLPKTEISKICRYLPQGIQENGKEIRSFMPKFGAINERRNQLHEVIRLSGMNIIIDDTDHPLTIKVASIQSAKMQVYFIDNEDFFNRKCLFEKDGVEFDDNDERAIFFAKGVLETVKKLRWSPEIVHCNGWFTGIVPILLKKGYVEDPIFEKSKIVYSLYENNFKQPLDKRIKEKLLFDGIESDDLKTLGDEANFINFNKFAIDYSDAIICGSEDVEPALLDYAKQLGKPILEYQPEETYVEAYSAFYDTLIGQ
jgi:starch synthase